VVQPFRGVNLVGKVPIDLPSRVQAFAPLLREGDAYSHSTAALLYGAPLPHALERQQRLHVTSSTGDSFRRRGIVGHSASSLPIALHLGVPVVEPAHAWFQLAGMLAHDDLVAVGDYLVTPNRRRRTPAIASLDALMAAIPERSRGAGRARRALADVRVGAESRMETLLRLLLIRAGLPEPLLNPPMLIEGEVLHPDFAYPQWDVVLEYEGDEHRLDPHRWRSDITRRERFETAGQRVIRVHADDVLAQREQFLARICRAIAQRRTLEPSGTLDQHPRDGGRLSE
jgi:hypothetical protein